MTPADLRAVEDALDELSDDRMPLGSAEALDRILRRSGLAIGPMSVVDYGDEKLTRMHIEDGVAGRLSAERLAAVETLVSLFDERVEEDADPVAAIVSLRTGEKIADAVSLAEMKGMIQAARDDFREMESGDD